MASRVKLNVGGQRFEVRWSTLLKVPQTRLGRLAVAVHDSSKVNGSPREFCDDYDVTENEYFFERDPSLFPTILNYVVTGKLHLSRAHCIEAFKDEMCYWGMPFNLDPWCDAYYFHEWEGADLVQRADKLFKDKKKNDRNGSSGTSEAAKVKKSEMYTRKLWDLMENPESSKAAWVSVFNYQVLKRVGPPHSFVLDKAYMHISFLHSIFKSD